jgi:hypothetical protein
VIGQYYRVLLSTSAGVNYVRSIWPVNYAILIKVIGILWQPPHLARPHEELPDLNQAAPQPLPLPHDGDNSLQPLSNPCRRYPAVPASELADPLFPFTSAALLSRAAPWTATAAGSSVLSRALREQRCRHWRRASVSGIGAQPPLSVAGRSLLHRARLRRSSSGMINAADSNFHQKKKVLPVVLVCSTRIH